MPRLEPLRSSRRALWIPPLHASHALALVAALAAGPAAAQLLPLGGDIAVSAPDGDYESGANVALDRQGGWVAIWHRESLDGATAVELRRPFDRDDLPVAAASEIEADLFGPDIALDGAGGGAIVGIRPRPELGGAQVDALCFDPDGTPAGDAVRIDAGDISPATRVPSAPRIAMDTTGAFVVAWTETPRDTAIPPSVFFRRVNAACSPLGGVESLGAVGVIGRRDPSLAIRPDGGFVLAWIEGEAPAQHRPVVQRFDAEGVALGSAIEANELERVAADPTVVARGDGSFAVVWRSTPTPVASGVEVRVASRTFSAGGIPVGPELSLRPAREEAVGSLSAVAAGGVFVAVWGENGFVEEGSAVLARAFDEAGQIGPEIIVNEQHTDPDNVSAASSGGADFLVIWDDLAEGTLPGDIVARRFAFVALAGGCVENATTLCLLDGRFRVEVEWRNFLGQRGAGQSLDLTSDSGLFWFFDSVNLEMLVKMVDACGEFSRQWLFAAATTNVEYTLHVTDTATGRSRSYFNPLGRSSPAITDTDAFGICP